MNACRIFNIEFVTAIDFVLQAAKNGLITAEEAKNKIRRLENYGRYEPRIISKALDELGDKNE